MEPKPSDCAIEIDRYIFQIMTSKVDVVMDYKGICLFRNNPYIFIPYELMDLKEIDTCLEIVPTRTDHFIYIDQRITAPRFHKTQYNIHINKHDRLMMVKWFLIHVVLDMAIRSATKTLESITDEKERNIHMALTCFGVSQHIWNLGEHHKELCGVFFEVAGMIEEEYYRYTDLVYRQVYPSDKTW